MKKRLLCAVLAFALTLLLIPMPASAAAPEAADLVQQIKDVYRQALRCTNRYSFSGWCGTMVNWQLYLMGIDAQVYGRNGNDEYDLYSSMDVTTGGYKVRSYPASRYTLKEALNAITDNGTVDAYNIMVGFQWTHTAAGARYGHAMVIHGIIDGMVYFSESYSTSLGGQYYPEGAPIICDIDTFCDYYNAWTRLDGVVHFGLKSYAQMCDSYPTGMYAMAPKDLALYAEPCDPGVYDAQPTDRVLEAGSVVEITALLQTPGGDFWYEFHAKGMTAYLPAQELVYHADCTQDVQLNGLRLPAALTAGSGYIVGGTLTAEHSQIEGVTVAVYPENGTQPVFSGMLTGSGKYVDLYSSALDAQMTFRLLEAGTYRIKVTAQVRTCSIKDGALAEKVSTLELWNSKLDVYDHWAYCPVVTIDANGGEVSVQQISVEAGKTLGRLPNPSRTGYIFTGWTLDREGKKPVTENTTVSSNVTLYAQWEKNSYAASGWQYIDENWQYFVAGTYVKGWFRSNGIQFYQDENGMLLRGLHEIDGSRYYFNEAGAMCTGWKTVNASTYYFDQNGKALTGRQQIDGYTYRFSEKGALIRDIAGGAVTPVAADLRLEIL